MTQNARLADGLQILERRKSELLESARNADDPTQKLDGNGWNLLELLTHFVLVEKYALLAVRSNIGKKIRRPFFDRFRYLMVRTVLGRGIKVKVPVDRVDPEKNREFETLDEIEPAWNEVRASMRELIDSLEPDEFNYCHIRHPIAGWMPLSVGFDFLLQHLEHHRGQMEQLCNQSGQPR